MKKSVKTVLITAAALLGAGVILIGAGSAAGGLSQVDQLNIGSRDFERLEEKLLEEAKWGGVSVKEHIQQSAGTYNGEEATEGQKLFNGDFSEEIVYSGTLKRLEIEAGMHAVEVVEENRDSIWLEGSGCDKVQCYVKGSTLYLKETGKHKKNSGTEERTLKLTIPADIEWEEAEICADMGSVTMEKLNGNEVELSADMGNVQIRNLKARDLDVSSDMGNIEVDDFYADVMEISTSMGNADLSGFVGEFVDAESDMGSIILHLDQIMEDFNYRISASMGSVKVGESEYSGLGNEVKRDFGADRYMELESSMGSIEIFFE